MMKEADRVEKALPEVSKTAAVPALETAARTDGSRRLGSAPEAGRVSPSRPWPGLTTCPAALPSNVRVRFAPGMANTARMFSSLSTTATTAEIPRR